VASLRSLGWLAALLVAVALSAPSWPAQARDPAPAADIGPPPDPGSEEQSAELAVVLWAQRTRMPEDVARAAAAVRPSLAAFSGALGEEMDATRLPLTRALLDRAVAAVRAETRPLKERYARPRPFAADPRVVPAVEREDSFSYPSGHATLGVVWAGLLADLRPERADALRLRGLQIGHDRVVAGLHWPSDVVAGQRLGAAILARLLADPAVERALREARAKEWAGG
jgi:acid phosphatase (class A)